MNQAVTVTGIAMASRAISLEFCFAQFHIFFTRFDRQRIYPRQVQCGCRSCDCWCCSRRCRYHASVFRGILRLGIRLSGDEPYAIGIGYRGKLARIISQVKRVLLIELPASDGPIHLRTHRPTIRKNRRRLLSLFLWLEIHVKKDMETWSSTKAISHIQDDHGWDQTRQHDQQSCQPNRSRQRVGRRIFDDFI